MAFGTRFSVKKFQTLVINFKKVRKIKFFLCSQVNIVEIVLNKVVHLEMIFAENFILKSYKQSKEEILAPKLCKNSK